MEKDAVQIRFGSPEELRKEFDKNISNRGIFIVTEGDFTARDPIDVDVILEYVDASEIAISLHGEVVHCIPVEMASTGATAGVAVQFEDSASELEEFFAPLLAKAAGSGAVPEPTSESEAVAKPRQGDVSPKTGVDQRKTRRGAVRVPARIMPNMSPPFEATTRDLSRGGILLTMRDIALPMGEFVRTCLLHPDGDPSVEIDGQVVREVKNKNGDVAAVAIAFDAAQAEDPRVRDVIDALRQAGHRSRLGGNSGSITDLGLSNMLQAFGQSAPTGTLVVERDGEQGWIAFENSQFLGAELGALTDRDALVAMLDWSEGQFQFEVSVDEKLTRSANPRPLEGVLFDAVCTLDEEHRTSDAESKAQESGEEQVTPTAEAKAKERAKETAEVGAGDFVLPIDETTTFLVDVEQEEISRASLDKTEEAVLELARSGVTADKLKSIIPESPEAVQSALEGLVELGVLIPR